jgi:hypothetical protein
LSSLGSAVSDGSGSHDYSLSFGSLVGMGLGGSFDLLSSQLAAAVSPPTPLTTAEQAPPLAARRMQSAPHGRAAAGGGGGGAAVPLLARPSAAAIATVAANANANAAAAAAAREEEFLVFVNPFRVESEEQLLQTRTHARRRWSHVFPMGEHEFKTQVVVAAGLNWKSLSTPAVLPLTTDYVPAANELKSDR